MIIGNPEGIQIRKQAKAYYEEIKDWIRSCVAELAENTSDDEIDVEGLGGVLQKEPEAVETGDSDNKTGKHQ